jgi:hypothetical protein
MVGSSIAAAIMNAFRSPEESIPLPEQQIIDYEIEEKNRRILLQNYYTLIEYRYLTGCEDCVVIKNELVKITQNSDGQIYFQELVSSYNKDPIVTITSLRGQKNLEQPTKEELEETICNILVKRPLWCVSSKV